MKSALDFLRFAIRRPAKSQPRRVINMFGQLPVRIGTVEGDNEYKNMAIQLTADQKLRIHPGLKVRQRS